MIGVYGDQDALSCVCVCFFTSILESGVGRSNLLPQLRLPHYKILDYKSGMSGRFAIDLILYHTRLLTLKHSHSLHWESAKGS